MQSNLHTKPHTVPQVQLFIRQNYFDAMNNINFSLFEM